MDESYLAFYTSKPFWVEGKPDLAVLQYDRDRFHEVMAEEMFSHSTKDYTLKVCRDSLFMVHIASMEQELQNAQDSELKHFHLQGKYYDYLNAIQLLFDSTVIRIAGLAIGNTGLRVGDAVRINKGALGYSIPQGIRHQFMVRYLSTYVPDVPFERDPRISQRNSIRISRSIFEEMVVDFEKIQDDYDSVRIFSQIMVSVGNYQLLNFTASLAHAWFVIEYFINVYWIEFLSEKQALFKADGSGEDTKWRNTKQIGILTGKDFPASVMSNMLELNGYIDHDIFNKIENVRKKRNNVVHSLAMVNRLVDKLKTAPQEKESQSITVDDCVAAFEVIRYFVTKTYDIDLRISTGLTTYTM